MIYLDLMDFTLKVVRYLVAHPTFFTILLVLCFLLIYFVADIICKAADEASKTGGGIDDWYGGGDA